MAPSSRSFTRTLRLRSVPKRLPLVVAAVFAMLTVLCMVYFRHALPHVPVWSALLPAVALTTFAGAWLADRARRRGGDGSLALGIEAARVVLADGEETRCVVDPARPFGAVLGVSPGGRRALGLSQNGRFLCIVDDARDPRPAPADWVHHSVSLQLDAIPLSGVSVRALHLADGERLDAVLESLGPHLATSAEDWAACRLASGESLRLGPSSLKLGTREVALEPGVARRATVETPLGTVGGLSIDADEEGTQRVLAAEEPARMLPEEVVPVPALLLAIVAQRAALDPAIVFHPQVERGRA